MVTAGFVGTERFELVRRLGEGGFGTVFETFDRRRSTLVALKLLRQAEGSTLYRFKREFRALADISHPNLVALDELLTDGTHWFFTMELVRGVPITEYVRPAAASPSTGDPRSRRAAGPLDERRLREVLPQLADALHTIHKAGIVHCDVKPSNVLVTLDGRVVVLDFGLVSEPSPAQAEDASVEWSAEDLVVPGTPAYMAPEQAMPQRVTAAADWYSVGVILYDLLTGELPFSGSHLDIIEAKRSGRPRPPKERNGHVPKELASLCMRLLHPDPARRPAGEAVLQSVGLGTVPPRTEAPASTSEVLVGRDSHLKQLEDAFQSTLRGESVVVFLSGQSGMGKTALMRRFLHDQRAREGRLLALTSRCYERESMPYKAIDPLVDALAQHLRRLRDIEVARLLPRDAATLARVFPVLRDVEEIRRAPEPPLEELESKVRQRAATALRDLLFSLAVRVPLVLAIDDAQWGDADSGSILQEVLRPPDPPPLLLLMAYRSEDGEEPQLRRSLARVMPAESRARMIDLHVAALSHDEARQLAMVLMAGYGGSGSRADTIACESSGSPFFVHELAEYAARASGSTGLADVVLERVNSLSPEHRSLLTAVALSAQSIPVDVARAAAHVEGDASESLQRLRASRLIRGLANESNIEPYHDRIRETVVSQLTDAERRLWHGRLAAAWEQSDAARPETLFTHYHAAGNGTKTAEYAVLVASRAEAALAFDRAAEFYGVLVNLEHDPNKQRTWLQKLGKALANAGRSHEAAKAFLRALDTAPAAEAMELERLAASEYIRGGYVDDAMAVLQRLLPRVNVQPPGNVRQMLVTLWWYRLLLALRGTRSRPRVESAIRPEDLLRIDVLQSISDPLSMTAPIPGYMLMVQAVWHALRAGEPKRMVMGLTSLAVLTALGGTRGKRRMHQARRMIDEAQRLAASLDDPSAMGRSVLAEGIVLKISGQLKQGVERLERANEIFAGCSGVRWETETAQVLIHDALYWMGEWARLAQGVPARRHAAEQRGDLYTISDVTCRLSPFIHLIADRVEDARKEITDGLRRSERHSHLHFQYRRAVCTDLDICLYTAAPTEASRRLDTAWPRLRWMLSFSQTPRIEMRFYRARIALALASAGDRAALRRASREASRLDRERAPWASALARLVRASILQARGRREAAVVALEEAERVLAGCDMALLAASALYRRGGLLGGDSGRALVEEGERAIRAQNVAKPDRVADLLTPGSW